MLRHAQFVDVGEAIRLTTGTTVNVRNALVVRASTGVFGGTGASMAVVEHLTVNGADRLAVSGVFANAAALTLRNCLINALTNTPPSYTGGSDNIVSTANTVTFATQRGGAHYLPSGSTRLGITVTNLLDPAGAAIRTVRVGSDGSTNLLSTSGYDTAGVLRASTNALGGVTTFAWSINGNGELVESSLDPAGATQVVTHYRDGGVRSVTGTGVQNRSVTRTFGAQYMDVGSTLVVDGSVVTETVMDAEGNPGDYVITIRDALGQVRRVDQGNSVRHAYAYNRLGQMVQEVDADGVTRLYRYNAEADIEYVAVDVNPANTTWDADGNPSIDLNQDRLIRQATDTTTHAGQTVRRQRRWEYPTAGSSTSVEVRAAMVTADARNAWTIDRGQTSAYALAMNRVAQTRNATNTAPDGSWTVAVYTSGRLTSRTAYASNWTQLSRETYGYDPHGRVNQVTDVRNGTRTQTYNAADLLVSDTTPASGTGQGPRTTTRQYSTAGRLTRVTLPDGANLDLAYAPDGLLTNRTGGRQPTVGYAYDAAGRLTTLRTWKNAGAQTGAKTTQWAYQDGTGFLVQKQIGAETPIQYTFTAAGRPKTEMVMGGRLPQHGVEVRL